MKREVLTLALRVAVPMTLLAVAPAQAATKISNFGYMITAPGTYQVTQDLSGSGNAITVLASNVDLHLGGHTLSGDGSGAGVDVEGAPTVFNVSIDHGTVQGFFQGIFLNNALNCKISSVTASGNALFGIYLSHSEGNTVTNNTTNQNYSGISCSGLSYGNTVSRNTATGNSGPGIQLTNGPTGNTVQDNTCSGSEIGIAVGDFGFGGVSQNTIQNNTVTLNLRGIVVELDYPANTGNTLQGNTALTNANVDLEDDNPPTPACANTWLQDTFQTAGGAGLACIH